MSRWERNASGEVEGSGLDPLLNDLRDQMIVDGETDADIRSLVESGSLSKQEADVFLRRGTEARLTMLRKLAFGFVARGPEVLDAKSRLADIVISSPYSVQFARSLNPERQAYFIRDSKNCMIQFMRNHPL